MKIMKKEYDSYFHLASEMIRMKPNLTDIKVLGNDTEKLL